MANYVEKKQLYDLIVDYKRRQAAADAAGKPRPRMPDSIGAVILRMCRGMASRYNFSGYPFIDEMVDDAIENCINAVEQFNPDESDNAFAYLSITIFYAFLRRIDREKKALIGKYKLAVSMIPQVSAAMHGSDAASPRADMLENEYLINLVKSHEAKVAANKAGEKVDSTSWKKRVK